MPIQKTNKKYCIKNNKTKRCNLSDTENETSKYCAKNNITQRCRNISSELREHVTIKGFIVSQKAYKYLKKILLNKTSLQITNMRKKHEKENLYIPIDKYPTDKLLKDYLFKEILELANNYARDKGEDIISIKAVKYVINEDIDLSILLKNTSNKHPKV